jgi:hypothetical protein
MTGEFAFLATKLGPFQNAADAQHTDVVRLVLDLSWHRRASYLLAFIL